VVSVRLPRPSTSSRRTAPTAEADCPEAVHEVDCRHEEAPRDCPTTYRLPVGKRRGQLSTDCAETDCPPLPRPSTRSRRTPVRLADCTNLPRPAVPAPRACTIRSRNSQNMAEIEPSRTHEPHAVHGLPAVNAAAYPRPCPRPRCRPTALPATVHLSAAVYRPWDCRLSTTAPTAPTATRYPTARTLSQVSTSEPPGL